MFLNYISPHAVLWLCFDKFHKILYTIDLNPRQNNKLEIILFKLMPFLWEKIVHIKSFVFDDIDETAFFASASYLNKFIGIVVFDGRLDKEEDLLVVIDVETGKAENAVIDRNIIGGGLMKLPSQVFDDDGDSIGGNDLVLMHSTTLGWIMTNAECVGENGPFKNLVIYQLIPAERNGYQWRKITAAPDSKYRCVLSTGDTIYCFLERFAGWNVYDIISGKWSEIRCNSAFNPWHYASEWFVVSMDEDFYIVYNPFNDAEKILKINRIQKLVVQTSRQFLVPHWDWPLSAPWVQRWEVAGECGLVVTPATICSAENFEWAGGILSVKILSLQDVAFKSVMLKCPMGFSDLKYARSIGLSEILVRIYFGPNWTL